MGVLSGLQPERVFYYFEEITKIPHGSGNVDAISDYIADFGKAHGLTVIQDRWKNVILIKEASAGYEEEPAVILQGHMDMVAVAKPELNIDMKTTPLKVAIDEKTHAIYAEGTSLGGDDGIAVAMSLAILEDDTISHPRLEVVITTDEEVGMDGAREIDLSMLKGQRLLNLDSEEEGFFLTSCAGGGRVSCKFDLQKDIYLGRCWVLKIGGLMGGHSGEEIHREGGNSNKLMGRLLYLLQQELSELRIVELNGGLADNAIPRETTAKIMLLGAGSTQDEEEEQILGRIVEQFRSDVAGELAGKDPGFFVELKLEPTMYETKAFELGNIPAFLMAAPNGVQAYSKEMEGMVETSLNLGILKLTTGIHKAMAGSIEAVFAVRSSIDSAKVDLIHQLQALTNLAGGNCTVSGEYPGWKYRADSPMREKMISVYEEMYGKKPVIKAIHAGLECGLLGSKIDNLDCVSIGPDMKDIHTTEEQLSIESTRRVYGFVVRFLAQKD